MNAKPILTLVGQTLAATLLFIVVQPSHAQSPDSVFVAVYGEQRNEGDSGSSTMSFRIRGGGATSAFPMRVSFESADAQATAGSDYIAVSGEVELASSGAEAVVSVQILGDTVAEPDETFELRARRVGGATMSRGSGSIRNDDANPALGLLQVFGGAVREGNSGLAELRFDARTPSGTPAFLVNFATTTNGSATPGDDFVPQTGSFTLGGGVNSRTVTVSVVGDTSVEANESIGMTFSSVDPVLNANATGVILNDDGETPRVPHLAQLVPIGGSITEPATGTATAEFLMVLTGPALTAMNVNYSIDLGASSATAGLDFTAPLGGVLSFAPGQRVASIPFNVLADAIAETQERVRINFTAPPGVMLMRPSAELLINDAASASPSGIALLRCAPFVAEGALARVVVRRIGSATTAASVAFATSDGSAREPGDYTAATGVLSWAAGDSSSRTIDVASRDDDLLEPPEFFRIDLSQPSGTTILGSDRIALQIFDIQHLFADSLEADCISTPE